MTKEFLNPNPKTEMSFQACQKAGMNRGPLIRISGFGFLSGFGLRISEFRLKPHARKFRLPP